MNINERFESIIKELYAGNQSSFAKAIGVNPTVIANVVGARRGKPSYDVMERICANANISPEWLLTGRGEMLKSSTSETVTPDAQPEPKVTTDPAEGKPYFDVDFLGGFHEIFNDQTNLPALRIIVPGFEKADLWCNVTGHSMEPRISHGDIIALRQCSIDDIQYGEIYAVVLDSIRTIKILRRGPSPDTLLFVPINKPDFEDQPFPIARIIRIFEVIGSISKFF